MQIEVKGWVVAAELKDGREVRVPVREQDPVSVAKEWQREPGVVAVRLIRRYGRA